MLPRIVLAFLITIATSTYADVTRLSCVQSGPAAYNLSYSLTGNSREVQIFVSSSPDASAGMQPILRTRKSAVTVHAGKPGQRMYFFLKTNTGEQREVSIRHLPLEGTPNFRDLGGYETTDGHFVRWGLLYRSGVLSYLTDRDLTYLSQMDIRVFCDFRTKVENDVAPEKWIPSADVVQISLPIGGDSHKNSIPSMQSLLATNPSPAELRAWLTKTYGNFAFAAAPEYSSVFKQLEEDHLPLLYHCTAGKDRTGVFSAFLLLALGVPEQTVLADYALTNIYLPPNSQFVHKMIAASANDSLAKLSPGQRNVLMAADPEYLRSTLRTIDAKYGSFDNYRRQELHVSDSDVQELRSRLLTQ